MAFEPPGSPDVFAGIWRALSAPRMGLTLERTSVRESFPASRFNLRPLQTSYPAVL
jgi:hypothetical protein